LGGGNQERRTKNKSTETIMSLGQTLRQAREAKGLTASQVADATRMMVQVVEDLEREDFRRIAAPIYGRGFIKLCAEHLGLDAEPLIREFMEIYTGSRPPQVARRPVAAEEEAGAPVPSDPSDPSDPTDPTDRADRAEPASASGPAPVSSEPDLFTVAAGRSDAVRSVAEPVRPGDDTPPRVRPAAAREEAPPAEPSGLRVAPVRPRASGALRGRWRQVRGELRGWLPEGWLPARIAVVAGIALLAIVLAVVAVRWLRHATAPQTHQPPAPIVDHALPPPEPYFD
jgi:cytoskeleton protein RodZ